MFFISSFVHFIIYSTLGALESLSERLSIVSLFFLLLKGAGVITVFINVLGLP